MAEIDRAGIEDRLGYRFRDPGLLERALTHRSHAHEVTRDAGLSYETLEFLGDALLGFLVSDWLLRADPGATEGVLTRRRQRVVRTETLARCAGDLGLGQELRLSRGEDATGGRSKQSLLADVFEAVLAAVYLDGGLRVARAFARRHLKGMVAATSDSETVVEDYKTRLQETVQAELRRAPTYRIVSSTGPDHARFFRVQVRVGRRVLGSGSGTSRKRAEQKAAEDALAGWKRDS